MKKSLQHPFVLAIFVIVALASGLLALEKEASPTYLPLVAHQPTPTFTPTPEPTVTPTPDPTKMVEFRGLWVTRFDWNSERTPAKIDEIVHNAAYAGFNAILFQVRGEADAFYNSQHEPWSQLMTGTLGQHPGWDPLAYMIEKAHARGIQVHAYINVYPVWLNCDNLPSPNTTPKHLYYKIIDWHGTTSGKPNGLQWNSSNAVICNYYRSSPASQQVDDHLLAVATDLVTNYDIDGLHLDHIRYAGSTSSCDPVSVASYGVNCFGYNGQMDYRDWQRAQVNGTVYKFYHQIVPLKPGLWLTAAVWPTYATGYNSYYQDPREWLRDGYIDAINQMIYPASSFSLDVWTAEVSAALGHSNGRYIIPGIGSESSFATIEARINKGRQLGTAGHAIFSYGSLHSQQYFDDLANGPYAVPAIVPPITWHN